MAPMRVAEDPIQFVRSTGTILVRCGACSDRTRLKPQEVALSIEYDAGNLVLCEEHEGLLLEKLLANYLKRRNRKRTVGFIGPVRKVKDAD